MKLSVVIPVYNEQGNIRLLAEELAKIADGFERYEVLLVDDGSEDETWAEIIGVQDDFPFVRGVQCEENRGQSAALLRGFAEAREDYIATLDGDLQNDPADIPKLVKLLGEYDVVCGYRANRKDTWSRRIGSKWANAVRNRVTGDGMIDTGCSLKVFRREWAADLPPLDGMHRFMPAYFMLHGRKLHQVPVNHRPRLHGESKYTNFKRLPRTIKDLWGFAWYRSRFLG